jgi:glutathione S-transferase
MPTGACYAGDATALIRLRRLSSRARLYSLVLSHPGHAARRMLEWKGIEHEVRYLLTGSQPLALRALGFRGATTPALKIDGRRIQGSRSIAAALEDLKPEPALYPRDAGERAEVKRAEEWGEREFQPVPRRLLRWGFKNVDEMLTWAFASELDRIGISQVPARDLLARSTVPVANYFARISGSTEAAVRADLESLPALLRHVADLIEAGAIGGATPNAADFQIGTTARLLHSFEDLRPLIEGTPAGELGLRILPDFDHRVPAFIPSEWIPDVGRAG